MIAILKDRVPVVWIRYDWMTSQSVAHSTAPAKVSVHFRCAQSPVVEFWVQNPSFSLDPMVFLNLPVSCVFIFLLLQFQQQQKKQFRWASSTVERGRSINIVANFDFPLVELAQPPAGGLGFWRRSMLENSTPPGKSWEDVVLKQLTTSTSKIICKHYLFLGPPIKKKLASYRSPPKMFCDFLMGMFNALWPQKNQGR